MNTITTLRLFETVNGTITFGMNQKQKIPKDVFESYVINQLALATIAKKN